MLLHDNEIQKMLHAPQLTGFWTEWAVLWQAFSGVCSETILGVL